MKRAALVLAFLSAVALSGCGVRDAGRWLVGTSLRSAYGCSLLVSSDQMPATAGELAQRPQPLVVTDSSIVASLSGPEPKRGDIGPKRNAGPPVEIAELPISRDLSSMRPPGTMRARTDVRFAELRRAPRLRIHVARPEAPPSFQAGGCPSGKG